MNRPPRLHNTPAATSAARYRRSDPGGLMCWSGEESGAVRGQLFPEPGGARLLGQHHAAAILGDAQLRLAPLVPPPEPLDDLDVVAVRVRDEEPVRAGDRDGLAHLDPARRHRSPSGPAVIHVYGEVARADGVRIVRWDQVDL